MLEEGRRFLAVRRNSKQWLRHGVVDAEDLRDTVGVDAWDPDAAVKLVAVAVGGGLSPGVDVDGWRDGRPVVGDIGLEGAVEEKVILLALPDSRPVVMAELGELVDVNPSLKV